MLLIQNNTKGALELAISFNGSNPKFSHKRDFRKLGRGNPFLSRRRFKTIEDVELSLNNKLGL